MELYASWTVEACAALHAVMAIVELLLFRRAAVYGLFGYTREQAELLAPVVEHVGSHNFFLAIGLAFASSAAGMIGFYARTFFLLWAMFTGLQAAIALKKWFPQILQIALAVVALALTWLAAPPG